MIDSYVKTTKKIANNKANTIIWIIKPKPGHKGRIAIFNYDYLFTIF
jgi:hypothetical protein